MTIVHVDRLGNRINICFDLKVSFYVGRPMKEVSVDKSNCYFFPIVAAFEKPIEKGKQIEIKTRVQIRNSLCLNTIELGLGGSEHTLESS